MPSIKVLLFFLLPMLGHYIASAEKEERINSLSVILGDHKKLRLLRGGSYSRGGSSYNRGGSSSWSSNSRNHNSSNNYHYNRNNNYNRRGGSMSTMGKIFTGLAIAGIGLTVLALMFGSGTVGACLPLLCCCGAAGAAGAAAASSGGSSSNHYINQGYSTHNYQPNRSTNYGNNGNQYQFQNRVQQAKGEVESVSFHVRQQQGHSIQPFSGHYTTTFIDPESGAQHNASISLFFTPDPHGNGYRINGQGSDIDGNTVIEDGFANHDGSSWWIEKNITGDMSLQVLSRGSFNFRQQTFEGTWLANTMLSGPYLSFVAMSNANANANANINSSSIPITNAGITQNIPVVTGTMVSPHKYSAPHQSEQQVPISTVLGTPI